MVFQYILKKKENEIHKYFMVRDSFIKLLNPKNEKQFKLYEAYSNIFINIFFLKCRYNMKTEEFIKKFMKKYKNKLMIELNNSIL